MKRFCCISSVIILIFFSTLLLSGERAVESPVAANVITTAAVGTGPPSGNTFLRTLKKKIFQDMERGQFNPSDVKRLKREQKKAFLESGGDPRDIKAIRRGAMRDLVMGVHENTSDRFFMSASAD